MNEKTALLCQPGRLFVTLDYSLKIREIIKVIPYEIPSGFQQAEKAPEFPQEAQSTSQMLHTPWPSMLAGPIFQRLTGTSTPSEYTLLHPVKWPGWLALRMQRHRHGFSRRVGGEVQLKSLRPGPPSLVAIACSGLMITAFHRPRQWPVATMIGSDPGRTRMIQDDPVWLTLVSS